MTHSSIIAHLYNTFSVYRKLWSQKFIETGELGALVFLPDKELDWIWWPLPDIKKYIRQGGLNDEELLEGLEELDIKGEFLVLVIEYVDGPVNQKAHFHRMSKVRLN